MTQKVDTLIIGAGLVGSSVAMHLARLQGSGEKIRVVDFDLEGTLSSSELNAGGVRATWVQPVNIDASKVSIDYYASIAEEIGYRPCGYLWLHSPKKIEAALKARDTQIKMGWDVEAWDIPELRRRVPFIDKTDGIAGAVFGVRDGLINPNLLKNHFREKARAAGVQFDDRVLIRSVDFSDSGSEMTFSAERFEKNIEDETKGAVLGSGKTDPGFFARVEQVYQAKRVVNCAGAWASRVAELLETPCPSQPIRRQVCIFDCRDVDLTPYGMMIDPSGVYFHPEATNGLAGYADPNEPPGPNYDYDGEDFFNEKIWPQLYERSTKFERLKHLTGWAGLYEVSPDESAIIGKAPKSKGQIYEAHSFSGHGAMHSYAAGLAIAELIAYGRYETIDFSVLSGERFEKGQLIKEKLVI